MLVKDNSQPIQAFPIQANTYVGTPTNLEAKGYNIVHVAEDATVTFIFEGGSSVVVAAKAGMDLAIGNGVLYITATATVWVS